MLDACDILPHDGAMKAIRAFWSRLFFSERRERLARIDQNLERVVNLLKTKL
jgi:hypothetical protein